MIFGCQSSVLHRSIHVESKQGYACKDLQFMSVEHGFSWKDIHIFMHISIQSSMLLWTSIKISMDHHPRTRYGFSFKENIFVLTDNQ